MNHDDRRFPSDVETGIAGYLRQVERNLRRAHRSDEETRGILEDIDVQIRTQLSATGPKPSLADLNAVLGRMDPPSVYADANPQSAGGDTSCCCWGNRGLKATMALLILAVAGAIVYYAAVDSRIALRHRPQPAVSAASTPSPDTTHGSGPVSIPPKQPAIADTAAADSPISPRPAPPSPAAVAVVGFSTSENIKDHDAVALTVSDGIIAALAGDARIRMVEREKLTSSLTELRMSAEGLVTAETAIKLGNLTGAQIIITGNIVKIDDHLTITARLINSETGEMSAVKVTGDCAGVSALSGELAKRIAERISNDTSGRIGGRAEDTESARIAEKQAAIRKGFIGRKIPRVLVMIPETHLSLPVRDPAAETELVSWLTECGFPVASPEYEGVATPLPVSESTSDTAITFRRNRGWRNEEGNINISSSEIRRCVTGGLGTERAKLATIADLVILGEGISERAVQREGLISCKARVELKVVDIRSGSVLAAESTYGAGVDVAERIAGKRALQAAGGAMAERLLPVLVDKWQESTQSQ